MNIITISREFGSGGRELGKRLAEALGYDYYDNEILTAVAEQSGLDEAYVKSVLRDHGWQNYSLSFHATLGGAGYINTAQASLLSRQREVIEQIAALGKDCVIVGRNADLILEKYQPLNLFVCSTPEEKVARCKARAPEGEHFSDRELMKRIRAVDRERARSRALLTGAEWGHREDYHLIINTAGWVIKDLVGVAAEYARAYFSRPQSDESK